MVNSIKCLIVLLWIFFAKPHPARAEGWFYVTETQWAFGTSADPWIITDSNNTFFNHPVIVRSISSLEGYAPTQVVNSNPQAPFACNLSNRGKTVYVDDTDDLGAAGYCFCGQLANGTYDWLSSNSILGQVLPPVCLYF